MKLFSCHHLFTCCQASWWIHCPLLHTHAPEIQYKSNWHKNLLHMCQHTSLFPGSIVLLFHHRPHWIKWNLQNHTEHSQSSHVPEIINITLIGMCLFYHWSTLYLTPRIKYRITYAAVRLLKMYQTGYITCYKM